jgi:hypothetical protein
MANYLSKASGRPSEVSTFSSDAPNKAVDEMYRVQLYNTKGRAGATGRDALMISGNLYENFAINVSSEWETSFAQIVDSALSGGITALSNTGKIGNLAAQAIQASGYTNHILGSARNWGGTAHLTFDLPLRVDAWNSTTGEIMEPMKQLLQSIAPDIDSSGILLPPGPNPVSLVTNVSPSQIRAGSVTEVAQTFKKATTSVTDNKFLAGPLDNAKDWETKLNNAMLDKAFTLNIGTFWKMFPAVVSNVTSNFSSAFEHGTGHPISVEFNIQVESYFTPTKFDFENWIRING